MLRFAFKPRHPITRVAFTADGREVITAQPFTGIAVRDRLTGVVRANLPLERTTTIHSLRIYPELGWLIARTNRTTLVLDVAIQHLIPFTVSADGEYRCGALPAVRVKGFSSCLEMTSDGTRAVTIATGGPAILDVESTAAIARVYSPLRGRHIKDQRAVIEFSPDGSKLALGEGETLSVYDLPPLRQPVPAELRQTPLIQPLFTLERPDPTRHGTFADRQAEYWLPPVAFDHAGRTMFTLGLRNRVQRIDLATGGVMGEWGWRCEPIRSLAVAPDDLTAVAGCKRGELVLWDLE